MSSKLREDLPYRDERWDQEALDIFNRHRNDYKKVVETAKSFYGDRAFIANGEAANYSGFQKLLLMMVEQGANVAQLLLKCVTDQNNRIHLSKSYDVLTAFYIPLDIQWLRVAANGVIIGDYHGKCHELELDELLRQSWTIPHAEDNYLEYILWVSRQGKIGFAHNQEETIEIDGVDYRRLIFMQPMLPIVQCSFADICIETSGPATLYLEVSTAAPELRNKLAREAMIAWIDDLDQEIPLVQYAGGVVSILYHGIRPGSNPDLLPALELPPLHFTGPALTGPSLDDDQPNQSFA